jgi:outer membrane murein-binding lipoprotein Lpp
MAGMDALATAALAGLPVLTLLLVRRVRGLAGHVTELSARVDELTTRLEAAEQDAAAAVGRTEVAETVLLDKGLADEEDLEAARRRYDETPDPAGSRDLH